MRRSFRTISALDDEVVEMMKKGGSKRQAPMNRASYHFDMAPESPMAKTTEVKVSDGAKYCYFRLTKE
jgi:hypothetical protein